MARKIAAEVLMAQIENKRKCKGNHLGCPFLRECLIWLPLIRVKVFALDIPSIVVTDGQQTDG